MGFLISLRDLAHPSLPDFLFFGPHFRAGGGYYYWHLPNRKIYQLIENMNINIYEGMYIYIYIQVYVYMYVSKIIINIYIYIVLFRIFDMLTVIRND